MNIISLGQNLTQRISMKEFYLFDELHMDERFEVDDGII